MISAEIVADSLSPQGDRLTSLLITFPRFILAEINTHRMLSKNTSSSRAIPFNKMVEAIQNNPFIPIAWQKDHKGMQGNSYLTNPNAIKIAEKWWLRSRDNAIKTAKGLSILSGEMGYEDTIFNTFTDFTNEEKIGVTKQLCNRLLEPFMWTTMLITGSKEGWDNFFELRCPQYRPTEVTYKSKRDAFANENFEDFFEESDTLGWLSINEGQAEIHIMDLAEKIYDAMNESTPKQLKAGEWHVPFEDTFNLDNLEMQLYREGLSTEEVNSILQDSLLKIKISTAMAARTSYTVVGNEKSIDTRKMINLHDRLIEMRHDSPLEHCAKAMNDYEYNSYIKGEFIVTHSEPEYEDLGEFPESAKGWCRNFKGFIQYRHLIETNK